eukprot:NODE_252_length_11723_cov_1.965933.p10 type:complete len:121 gc:universal NODE_252_length_11723_cov_1.965933:4393-4031(-)
MQDLPPKEKFASIKYQRNLPNRGPSSALLLLGVFSFMGYGWYHFLKGFEEQEELKREKAWLRISLMPFLQAESDRNTVRILHAAKERGLESPYKTKLAQDKLLPTQLPLDPEGIKIKSYF